MIGIIKSQNNCKKYMFCTKMPSVISALLSNEIGVQKGNGKASGKLKCK